MLWNYTNKKRISKLLPSYPLIVPQQVYQVGVTITKIDNEYGWSNPKHILQNFNPRPTPRTHRWERVRPRACIILEIITAGGITLTVPLPHIPTSTSRSPTSTSWSPTRHFHTKNDNPTTNSLLVPKQWNPL